MHTVRKIQNYQFENQMPKYFKQTLDLFTNSSAIYNLNTVYHALKHKNTLSYTVQRLYTLYLSGYITEKEMKKIITKHFRILWWHVEILQK